MKEITSLSTTLTGQLNEQIKKEAESAYLYLQIAAFFEKKGLSGFADWFKIQAQEEFSHAKKIYDYLMQNNAPVTFYEIQPSAIDFHSFLEPLERALNHERFVTDSISSLYKEAEKEEDYRSQEFLNWFIHEQLEEEVNAQNLLDSYLLFVGNDGNECSCALFELDKRFGKRKSSSEEEA